MTSLLGRYKDYRLYLRAVLTQRCQNNARYSLRAFARDLAVSPPRLSEVLNGKKGLSLGAAAGLCEKLGLNGDESGYFCDLVLAADSRTDASRRLASLRLAKYDFDADFVALKEDAYRVIADWYHYAILELTFVQGFKADSRWIARQLGISTAEAVQAVERLGRLGLLARSGGTLVKTEPNVTTTHDVPNDAVRKTTAQLLRKAEAALEVEPVERRDFSTMTMAIDPARLPEAKRKIARFRRELAEELEQGKQTSVYTLAVQLFRVSKD